MVTLSAPLLYNLLTQLEPSEFKGQQIALEEMTFVMNDDLLDTLYTPNLGFRTFVKGGFEYQKQGSYNQYTGYSTNAFYEFLGMSYGQKHYQLMGALGAEQVWTFYKKTPSHSSSQSILASLGAVGLLNRWNIGGDLFFGYHFINTSRTIDYFQLKAHSSHGAYSLKSQVRGSYTKPFNTCQLLPYDEIAFLYTQEGSFQETGASCLSLEVLASKRQVLRNTLGMKFIGLTHDDIQSYIDLSYVYEQRWQGQKYSAFFINTDVPMNVEGIGMSHNFIKFIAGLNGKIKSWDWGIRLNGQYGRHFTETGVSGQIDRRF
jgi:hypothetical protein